VSHHVVARSRCRFRRMHRYFVGPRPGFDGDRVLLRFDGDPRKDSAAAGATYVVLGDTWVPDTTGFLGALVRDIDGYREIPCTDVMRVKMRLAVDDVHELTKLLRGYLPGYECGKEQAAHALPRSNHSAAQPISWISLNMHQRSSCALGRLTRSVHCDDTAMFDMDNCCHP
jgi:hypothetical protein